MCVKVEVDENKMLDTTASRKKAPNIYAECLSSRKLETFFHFWQRLNENFSEFLLSVGERGAENFE